MDVAATGARRRRRAAGGELPPPVSPGLELELVTLDLFVVTTTGAYLTAEQA